MAGDSWSMVPHVFCFALPCQDDDADTEAPTEESDYDPFAGAQATGL